MISFLDLFAIAYLIYPFLIIGALVVWLLGALMYKTWLHRTLASPPIYMCATCYKTFAKEKETEKEKRASVARTKTA
jgi:hypothetical protein